MNEATYKLIFKYWFLGVRHTFAITHSLNHSIIYTTHKQPISQSANHLNKARYQLAIQSINLLIIQSVSHSNNQTINQPTNQSVSTSNTMTKASLAAKISQYSLVLSYGTRGSCAFGGSRHPLYLQMILFRIHLVSKLNSDAMSLGKLN